MGKYKSIWTGPQIDEGVGAARNPDTVPTSGSDALITSDAVEKVQQGFAPIESDATASQAYAIGDLLVWGGRLYKAKTAIAVNDSFTVGTNIEATTIADKLNNIDTEITPDTDTTLTGVLTGTGSKVGSKALDTSSLTNDNDHMPTSGVVKSALTQLESDLASIHATGSTNTTGAKIDAGTYFYLNGVLVRAKVDIAVNATFTSGTNYTAVTAGGLNDLMNAVGKKTLVNSSYQCTTKSSMYYTGASIDIPANSYYALAFRLFYGIYPGTGGDPSEPKGIAIKFGTTGASSNSYAPYLCLDYSTQKSWAFVCGYFESATTLYLHAQYAGALSNNNLAQITGWIETAG